ncbi:hypothetical protein HELRODRAFT_167547 [Helobdella robusta]|uniref:Uncharacterized protein n=1 Tax=Helobdella robusta TaxID=6412 RepID=T1EZH2_HELRO|nr:hypothetical protein HELRODRAFT_167547 [Helobdella robusta]ESO11028.1 hypothetical protein HELRODRAFT_167547 [Helobdella robusta]
MYLFKSECYKKSLTLFLMCQAYYFPSLARYEQMLPVDGDIIFAVFGNVWVSFCQNTNVGNSGDLKLKVTSLSIETFKESRIHVEKNNHTLQVQGVDYNNSFEIKIEYTIESEATQGRSRRNRLVSVNENKNELIDLFANTNTTFQQIFDWIHVERSDSDDAYQLEEERMVKFLPVIKTLTVDRPDRQVEILFGLQDLAARLSHPPCFNLYLNSQFKS